MVDQNDFIQDILNKATLVPPALRDYSTGIIAWAMRQEWQKEYPGAVEAHYQQYIDPDKFPNIKGAREAQQRARNRPLSTIPGFTNVQRAYDASALHSGATPLVDIIGKDRMGAMERGEQKFEGLETVGDLQNFVLSTIYEEIINAGATRAGGNVLESVAEQITAAAERQLSYIPGVNIFTNRKEKAASSMDWMIHGATKAVQDQFYRQKDPLADVGVNQDISILQMPSWPEGDGTPLVQPIPGSQDDYQVPGLFTHTGKVFTSEENTNYMLEDVLTVRKPGWSPVTVTKGDITRLDRLFAHTANQGQPTGLSYDAFKANPPNIETWRMHFSTSPREATAMQGRDPVPYTMVHEDQLARDRAQIYRDMPVSWPTGYFIDENGQLTTQERSGMGYLAGEEGRAGDIRPFGVTDHPRRRLNISSLQIKFLLGHQTPAEEQLARERGWDNIIDTIPVPKSERGSDYIDRFDTQRSIARRIFNQQERLSNTPGSHTYEHGEILNWEGQTYARENEEANTGMMYNAEDSTVERASEQGYRYVARQQVESPTRKAMNFAMRAWRSMGAMFQWALAGETNLGYQERSQEERGPQPYKRGVDAYFGSQNIDYTPVTSRDVNIRPPSKYPHLWRQKDIYGSSFRNLPMEEREPRFPTVGVVLIDQPQARQLLRRMGITTYWTDDAFGVNTEGQQLSLDSVAEEGQAGVLLPDGTWHTGGEDFRPYAPRKDIHSPLSPYEYDRQTHRRLQVGDESAIVPIRNVPGRGQDLAGSFPMNKRYQEQKREGLQANNTLRAIEMGERTATTRWGKQAEALQKLKVGDVVEFVGGPASGGRKIYARITHEAYEVGWNEGKYDISEADELPDTERGDADYEMLEEWSEKEGWSMDRGVWNFENRGVGTQIQFEYLEPDSINVLPREHEFDSQQRQINFHRLPENVNKKLIEARIGPPSQAYTDMLRGRYMWWEGNEDEPGRYVPSFMYLDEKPTYEEIYAPARKWEKEDQARRDIISDIKARQTNDPVGVAMVEASNRQYQEWKPLQTAVGKKISKALYSAGMSLLEIMQNPPEPDASPPIEGMSDVVQSSVPQSKRENQFFDLGAMASRVAVNSYARWLVDVGGVDEDEALRRAHHTITSGHEFKVRSLEVSPRGMPDDALSEKQAFAGSSSRGIAIGNYGYLRGTFLTQKELEKKYSGRTLLQKSHLEGKAAGSHEIGHVVYSKLIEADPKLKEQWTAYVTAYLEKEGWEKMLAADVPGVFTEEGMPQGVKEEFAQAYAIAATQGSDALRAYYPEYADFFEDNKELIEELEREVSLIRFKSKSDTKEFRARQLEVHGELPPGNNMTFQYYSTTGMQPGGFMPQGQQPYGPNLGSTPGTNPTAQQISQAAAAQRQAFQANQVAANAAIVQRAQAQYQSFTASQGIALVQQTLDAGGLTDREQGILANKATPMGATLTPSGWAVRQTGELLSRGSDQDINQALNMGTRAVEDALSAKNFPSGGEEFAASLITRANEYISSYYDKIYKEAPIGVEKSTINALKNVARNAVEETVLQSIYDKEDYGARSYIRSMKNAARAQPITTAKQWVDVAMGDPEIKRRMESGEIKEDMMTGPAQVFEGEVGAYRFGGEPSRLKGGMERLNLWGGRAGALMYSSYIIKRMWNMTAGPVMQNVQEYGKYMGGFASVQQGLVGGDTALGATEAGFESRQASITRGMQRGAFQQMGGFQALQSAMLTGPGGEGVSRMMAAGGIAAGAAATGAVAAGTLAYLGGATAGLAGWSIATTLGAIAAPAAVIAGGAILTTAAGMEIYNSWNQGKNPDAPPVSLGSIPRYFAKAKIRNQAGKRLDGAEKWPSSEAGAGMGPAQMISGSYEADEAQIIAEMTPSEKAIYLYEGEPVEMRRARVQMEAVSDTTGEKVENLIPGARAMVRGLGELPDNFLPTIDTWSQMSMTGAEGMQDFINYASQMGYKAGTEKYKRAWAQFSSIGDIQTYDAQMSRAQRVGQFTGQIAQYFDSTSDAAAMVRKYDLTTASRMGPVQSMMGMAVSGGANMSTILGYEAASGRGRQYRTMEERAFTMGDLVNQIVDDRGAGMVANVDVPLQSVLQGVGMAPAPAMVAAGQLGFTTPTQVGAAGQWLGQANMFGAGYGSTAASVVAPIPGISNFQASIIPAAAMPSMIAGNVGAMGQLAGGMGQNFSDRDAQLISQGLQGDVGALNFLARKQIQGELMVNRPSGRGTGQVFSPNAMGPGVMGVGSRGSGLTGAVSGLGSAIFGGTGATMPAGRAPGLMGVMSQIGDDLTSMMSGQMPGTAFDNPYMWQSTNAAGQPIYQTDFGAWLRQGAAWESSVLYGEGITDGSMFTDAAAQIVMGDKLGAVETFFAPFGDIGDYAGAIAEGDIQGAMDMHAAKQKDFRRRGNALAGAGAGLAAQHLWGGGAWTGTPAEDSIWGLQDKMRAVQHRNQLSNFQFQREMMTTQNEFAIRQEDLTGTRMAVGHEYSRWQSGFQHQGAMMQRGWAREDMQYNTQMRDMSFGWQMEDFDEAIRTSTGRQRAQLVKKRDRASTKFNLEGEQIDRQESRQEEMWAREDERFAKAQEYQETMMDLDEEQFQLGKERRETLFEMQKEQFEDTVEQYKEQYALQTEMIAKQRDYQAAQIALQGAQAALQKEMNDDNEEFGTVMEGLKEPTQLISGAITEIVNNEPEKIFDSMSSMVVEMNKVSTVKLTHYKTAFNAMNNQDWNTLRELQAVFSSISALSPDKLSSIARALWDLVDASAAGG